VAEAVFAAWNAGAHAAPRLTRSPLARCSKFDVPRRCNVSARLSARPGSGRASAESAAHNHKSYHKSLWLAWYRMTIMRDALLHSKHK